MQAHTDAIAEMSTVWSRVRGSTGAATWCDSMEQMRAIQREIATAGSWTSGHAALMEVLEIPRREVANCKVLRWLLDPLARHGLGSAILRELALEVGLDGVDTSAAVIETEIARSDSRADVIISALDGNTLVIEAKIDAGESPSQGARLEQDWPEAHRMIFLTVDGNRLPSTAREPGRWVTISWRWFADVAMSTLDALPADNPHAHEARDTVAAWATMIRRILR